MTECGDMTLLAKNDAIWLLNLPACHPPYDGWTGADRERLRAIADRLQARNNDSTHAVDGPYRVEGSIYENMAASVVSGPKYDFDTIAHCPEYEGAKLIASALNAASGNDLTDAWRPIETAPKDGLALVGGRWDDDAEYPGEWWWNIGSCFGAGVYGDWDNGLEPTHWQPLPEPPALAMRAAETDKQGEG